MDVRKVSGPLDENFQKFAQRKQDHIRLSLDANNQALGLSGLEQIELCHEALPELNFDEVSINQTVLELECSTPFIVSSMTAGHDQAPVLNSILAKACDQRGWVMGVGSQRRELTDSAAHKEWSVIRKSAPQARFLGNLGLAQVIQTRTDQVKALIDGLEAIAMIVHTNPLQECLQEEGTPQFKGGLKALTRLAKELPVPIILKETGCGFSLPTLKRLRETGVRVVDVSGLGGTHWGRIEGQRSGRGSVQEKAAETFANWGVSTVRSLQQALQVGAVGEIWASGGVRTGLDAAKLLAVGARAVGFAQPILEAALQGEEVLWSKMQTIEFELKVALFCTGSQNLLDLQQKGVWEWKNQLSQK